MSTYVRIMSIHLTVAGLFSSSTRRRRPLCQGSGDKVAKTFETSATSRVHLVAEDTGELKKKKREKTRVQREIKRGICRGNRCPQLPSEDGPCARARYGATALCFAVITRETA